MVSGFDVCPLPRTLVANTVIVMPAEGSQDDEEISNW
jgi:hypothetical protein